MPKKKKPDFPVPHPEQWRTMFAGMNMAKKGKEYFKPTANGWSKIFGDIDLPSGDAGLDQTRAEDMPGNYLARFLSPMSGVMQVIEKDIKPGRRYEVSYRASTNSRAGFLATTVTFLNSNNIPLGVPFSGGVKLNTLQPGSYSPVSFVTGPAPAEAAKAQLAFVVFGMEQDKVADIDSVAFKEIS